MQVFGYSRVSTISQAEDGDSLPTQERRIRAYCDHEGMTLTRMYVERGVSGSRPLQDRPEGKAMLGELRSGDLIVSPKLDRCFRDARNSLEILAHLKERRVGLVLLDLGGNATGGGIASLIFTIMAAVAAFERDRIAERIAEVKITEKEQGKFRGGSPPFGWNVNAQKMLEPVPEEQAALIMILKMSGEGLSLRKVQAAVSNAFGMKLSHVAIGRIVRDAKISRPSAASVA